MTKFQMLGAYLIIGFIVGLIWTNYMNKQFREEGIDVPKKLDALSLQTIIFITFVWGFILVFETYERVIVNPIKYLINLIQLIWDKIRQYSRN